MNGPFIFTDGGAGDMAKGFLPGVVAGGSWGDLGNLGPQPFENVEEFRKAVTAGYGTDVAALTGGGALRLQSLEPTLLKAIQEEDDHVLFNKLEKSNAGATVDEYTVKERIGGFPGSAFNSELGVIQEDQGEYERKAGYVKFLMTMRSVSAVQKSQKTLVDTMADQAMDATLELLTSAEWGCFYGDAACSPIEFDGIFKTIGDLGGDHVVDLRGESITPNAAEFIDSQRFIRGYGNHGRLTDFFCSDAVQADLDQKLDPAHRIMLDNDRNGDIKLGTPVRGIRTSWGNILANPDIFVQEGQPPFQARGGGFAANVASAGVTAPSGVAGVAGAHASSQFLTAQAGLYYYAVEGGNQKGRSALVKSAQVTVAAGDRVVVTITHAGGNNATYFVLYRSRRNGTNADGDFREMARVAASGGATTVYNDANQNIPGTSKIALLTMKNKAISIRRLLPMTRFPLYPTNTATYPWAQLFFLYLRIAKRKQHRVITNVLPSSQTWRPF